MRRKIPYRLIPVASRIYPAGDRCKRRDGGTGAILRLVGDLMMPFSFSGRPFVIRDSGTFTVKTLTRKYVMMMSKRHKEGPGRVAKNNPARIDLMRSYPHVEEHRLIVPQQTH